METHENEYIPPTAPDRDRFSPWQSCRSTSGKRCPSDVAGRLPRTSYDDGGYDSAAAGADDGDDAAVAAVVDAAAGGAMIDDVMIASGAADCVDAVWNFSLSASAPGRWLAGDPAVHCRRTALGSGR